MQQILRYVLEGVVAITKIIIVSAFNVIIFNKFNHLNNVNKKDVKL
jgi:hypothetical protein